jgi:tetratricopeptide (TPR) repeat protein
MLEKPENQNLLFSARLLLEEGQRDKALSVLEAICPHSEEERQERAYLLGWCHTLAKHWDDALHFLSPSAKFSADEDAQEDLLDRERRAFCLLRLGQIAGQFALYEEASRHYTKCLRALQDKRIHLPLAQIKARYGLAVTYSMRGLYAAAVEHYEMALGQCLYLEDDNEIGNIYCGLCDTYRRAGELIKARLAGKKALLYIGGANHPVEGQIHNTLGRISFMLGNYREAADHYTEALTLANSCNSSPMTMINCAALAEVCLAEGRLEEARRYCQLTRDLIACVKNEQQRGAAYLIIGKVTQAEAQPAEGEQKQRLLEEAIEWYVKAKSELSPTRSYADVAELYGRWAEAVEELGQLQAAFHCWKSGYETLSSANGQSWY